ncbi:hypothetical protein AVEN_247744-1 [Araneus ventricosus]|uniref:Uncharacterized protein n=1 Tax=Araneus ventricosus TaxID=182803 RepID=A0A4Y2SIH3_ARAVE|nr:hypothetical protein AVEN_247744-1 [Araneus ventricosus]
MVTLIIRSTRVVWAVGKYGPHTHRMSVNSSLEYKALVRHVQIVVSRNFFVSFSGCLVHILRTPCTLESKKEASFLHAETCFSMLKLVFYPVALSLQKCTIKSITELSLILVSKIPKKRKRYTWPLQPISEPFMFEDEISSEDDDWPKLDSGNDSSVITDKAEIDTETEEDADDIDQSHQSIAIEEDGKGADKDRKISWTTAIDNSKIEVN